MTDELFRSDGYLKTCEAIVTAVTDHGFAVDRTVFYPMGGGQPGDVGKFDAANCSGEIIDCHKDRETGLHLHIVAEGAALPDVGDSVALMLDWDRRYRLMRMHSCMHMLCAALPFPVTGGAISDGTGRLDFDLPTAPDKQQLEAELNRLVESDAPMSLSWISDAEMDDQPELIRTMSVQPPRGSGQVRIVNFQGVDLQPCGGTHVARSGEIGPVHIQSIKNKGKQNRRVTVVFA